MLLVAAAVRLGAATRQPLWADELFSLAVATGHSLEQPAADADPARGDFVESPRAEPPAHYARYLAHDPEPAGPARVLRATALSDNSPPLYYLLLWAWTRVFGSGDVALRLFSAVASLAALVLVVGLARRAAGRQAGLLAGLLFAFWPVGVFYSTEGRMYALLFLWTAAALFLAQRMHARGARRPLVALYGLVGGLGLLTHYFFAPVLAAVSAGLLLRPGRCRRAPLLAALAIASALALPWYAALPAAAGRWRVTSGWLKLVPAHFDPLWTRLRLPWTAFSVNAAEGLPMWIDYLNGVAILGLLACGLRSRGRRLFAGTRLLLWLAMLAGLLTPLAADLLLGTYTSMNPRYALAGLPAAVVLVAVLVASLRPRRQAFVAALLLALGLAGSYRVVRTVARANEPFDPLGRWLAASARDGDVAIVHSIPSGVCGTARALVRAGSSLPVASWIGPLRRREVPRDVEALAAGRRRVFLVEVHTVGDPVPEERWLREHARQAGVVEFEYARVLVFEPRQGPRFAGPPEGEARARPAS